MAPEFSGFYPSSYLPSSAGGAVSEGLGYWLGFNHYTLYWSCGVSNGSPELRSEIRLRQIISVFAWHKMSKLIDFFYDLGKLLGLKSWNHSKVNLGFHTIWNSCTTMWLVVVKTCCQHTCNQSAFQLFSCKWSLRNYLSHKIILALYLLM